MVKEADGCSLDKDEFRLYHGGWCRKCLPETEKAMVISRWRRS
jgi:hypothetical protein